MCAKVNGLMLNESNFWIEGKIYYLLNRFVAYDF